MNEPSSGTLFLDARFGLPARLLVVIALLAIETLFISGLMQSTPSDLSLEAARVTHQIQHWLFRFAIAYAA